MNNVDEDRVVTAAEMLQFQSELEDHAARIAKAGEVDACTYVKGYVSQPLYSCLTCNPLGSANKAGFCFGCSMTCHVDHEVVELFEKRHFRCDCGNKRSGQPECSLFHLKAEGNPENKYSHNFDGLYCYCSRPYDADVDEMFSCLVCQDWFHAKCVNTTLAEQEDSEFLCRNCLTDPSKAILTYYLDSVALLSPSASVASTPHNLASPSFHAPSTNLASDTSIAPSASPASTAAASPKREATSPATYETPAKRPRLGEQGSPEEKGCIKPPQPCPILEGNGVFLPWSWRSTICHCDSCMAVYRGSGLSFLVDEEERCNVGVLEAWNDDEDPQQPQESFSTEALATKALSTLPRDSTMTAAVQMRSWADRIKARLAEFHQNNPEAVITKDVMSRICEEVAAQGSA